MAFVHLHLHSHYSLLDGLPKIPDLIARVKELGMSSVALTDHGSMYGVIEFYQQAIKAGIQPIIGVETYVARRTRKDREPGIDEKPYHLVLLAENITGYKNLIKLVTKAHLEGFYYRPRVDWELLAQHHEGLIASTACLAGEVAQSLLNHGEQKARETIDHFIQIFGKDNVLLEVQPLDLDDQRAVNAFLFEEAQTRNMRTVATNDVHYLLQEDAQAQDILLCIQTKHKQSDTDRMSYVGQDLSLKSEEEMRAAFPEHPEACDNTALIAKRCSLELSFGKSLLPHFPLPEGVTYEEKLKELSYQGLSLRYPGKEKDPKILERLEFELATIEKTGFASYFLIVHDFVNWAKSNKIVVGPGRGSAAGSIVSYLLNITNVDPIRYELLFERFLNPERISMPDIDLDFADTRRDEVIRYVENKYGVDHVAQIITFGTMAARAAIRDVGRVLGLPYTYCDRVAKLVPMFVKLEEAIATVPELKEVSKDPEGKKLLSMALKLEGVARHSSTHACGVVITKDPLDEYVPTQFAAAEDATIVSQYSLHPIEDLGILKMDFLGLRNLTVIEQTLEIISKARGVNINIDAIPLTDETTFQTLQQGKTVGVFQLESSGMRRYLKELKPTSLEDIIVMVSLYRPGPMEFIPEYIAGKHGRKKISYIHPLLEPILNTTYGIVVYQEQVMRIARDLAGFTYGEADVLRKAVGKKIKSLLDEQRDKLIDGMVKHNIQRKTAESIWKFIEPFARYGFNRAHAACYAIIAYQTAYLKTHYPDEFIAALMTSDQQNVDRIAIEVEEAKQHGITVLPPDINESYTTFTAVFNIETKQPTQKIRFGLQAIKNVGENLVRTIVHERKAHGAFLSLENFLQRIQTKDLNKKSLESLTQSGALDRFGERNQLLENMDAMLKFSRSISDEANSRQGNLFANASKSSPRTLVLKETKPASRHDLLSWEKNLLGLYITEHPASRFLATRKNIRPIAEVINTMSHTTGKLKILGVVAAVKRITTKTMESMLFVRIEDQSGSIETIVFPKTLKANPSLWNEGAILEILGKFSSKDGETKIIVDTAHVVADDAERIVLMVPKEMPKSRFDSLRRALDGSPGSIPVFFLVTNGNGSKTIPTKIRVSLTQELRWQLQELVGEQGILID